MLNIGQYLYQLLLIHEQVGVPGIGIFKKERIPAGYNKEEGRFLPPSFTYSLLSHATVDHILLDFLAKEKQISDEEAREKIDFSVSKLFDEIAVRGEVELDKIGFLKQENNAYLLVPFTSSLSALQPIADIPTHQDASPLTTHADESAEVSNKELQAYEAVEEQEEETLVPLAPIEQHTTNNYWVKWTIATAVLVFIALFYFFYIKTSDIPLTTAITKNSDMTKQDGDQMAANIVDTTAATAINADTVSATMPEKTEEEPLVKTASKTLPYSIVIGSFKTLELAIKQAEYFRTIGINAFVLESKMPNNRKKICFGSYATKEEAQKDLPKVRNEINVEAYIYP